MDNTCCSIWRSRVVTRTALSSSVSQQPAVPPVMMKLVSGWLLVFSGYATDYEYKRWTPLGIRRNHLYPRLPAMSSESCSEGMPCLQGLDLVLSGCVGHIIMFHISFPGDCVVPCYMVTVSYHVTWSLCPTMWPGHCVVPCDLVTVSYHFTRSLCRTMLPGHCVAPCDLVTVSYHVTWSLSRTMLPGHCVVPCYLVTVSYHVTWSLCCTMWPGHCVVSCYLVTVIPCYLVTVMPCYLVTVSYHVTWSLSYHVNWSLSCHVT